LDVLFVWPSCAALRTPAAECRVKPRHDRSEGIVPLGCMMPMVRTFVLAGEDRFFRVDTAKDFAAAQATVASPEAALAFATALTTAFSLDSVPRHLMPIGSRFQPTRVTPAGEGFDVRVFDEQVCGCGLHPTRAPNVHVARDGALDIGGDEVVAEHREKTASIEERLGIMGTWRPRARPCRLHFMLRPACLLPAARRMPPHGLSAPRLAGEGGPLGLWAALLEGVGGSRAARLQARPASFRHTLACRNDE
jgi:hypothetical protein